VVLAWRRDGGGHGDGGKANGSEDKVEELHLGQCGCINVMNNQIFVVIICSERCGRSTLYRKAITRQLRSKLFGSLSIANGCGGEIAATITPVVSYKRESENCQVGEVSFAPNSCFL
jgi:hypothetical protein